MSLFPRAFPLDEEGKLKRLILLRMIMSTLIIGAAIMVRHLHAGDGPVVPFYSILGLYYLSNVAAWYAIQKKTDISLLVRLMTAVDIATLMIITHFTGGSSSYFTILLVLPIVISGEYNQIAGGLTAAGLVVSLYFSYSFLEMGGIIETPVGNWGGSIAGIDMVGQLLRGYLHMVLFVLTGLLSGYISQHILHNGEQLADRDKQIRQIQLDTDSILMNMSSGLVVIDMEGEVLSLNPSAMNILKLDKDERYKGKAVDIVLRHMPVLASELEFVLESGMPRKRHEVELANRDGSLLPLGISISLLKDESGETSGVIAIFQDLTEVKEMREKMRLADRMAAVGELSAAIAHEVRAPLASICGSIEMLKGEFELSGDNAELMDLIIRESDRLDRIITDFLEYARLRKPSFTPTDMDKCLWETTLLLKHAPNVSHNAKIHFDRETPGARIYADEEQIRQVLLNLGINACQAIGREGTLTISLNKVVTRLSENGHKEECVRIDFENDGPEIPEEVLPHVFEPFYTTREGGTGLGLAIAARIVESHSGLIKVRSAIKENTVFSVILPVYSIRADDDHQVVDEEESNHLQGV
jgi:two-component system sensor histidine kinase PilS (NtrC family)